jgi:hypothetical protein
MTEETYKCHLANRSGLKEIIRIGLDEAFTALEESLHDLDDEKTYSFPIPDQPNIASIVAHLLQNANTFALAAQGATRIYEGEDRWSFYDLSLDQMPKSGDSFPTIGELRKCLTDTQKAVFMHLDKTSEADLLQSRAPKEWKHEGNSSDLYIRVIAHHMAHLRQIWLMRGCMGLDYWPCQHWA